MRTITLLFVSLLIPTSHSFAKEAGSDAVSVEIVNECAQDVQARFVMPKPGENDAAWDSRVRSTPVTVLKAGKTTFRKMKVKEQLVVLVEPKGAPATGSMSQGFETREDAQTRKIVLSKDCMSIGSDAR